MKVKFLILLSFSKRKNTKIFENQKYENVIKIKKVDIKIKYYKRLRSSAALNEKNCFKFMHSLPSL